MTRIRRTLGVLLLLSLGLGMGPSLCWAQSAKILNLKVKTDYKYKGSTYIELTYDAEVKNYKGKDAVIYAQLYERGTPIPGATQKLKVAVKYKKTTFKGARFYIDRLRVGAHLGLGQHDLVAEIRIREATGSNRSIGRGTTHFPLQVTNVPDPIVKSTITKLGIETLDGVRKFVVHAHFEVNNLRNQAVEFHCQLKRNGSQIIDTDKKFKRTPKYKGSVWKDFKFVYSTDILERRLPGGRHSLTAVVEVRRVGARVPLSKAKAKSTYTKVVESLSADIDAVLPLKGKALFAAMKKTYKTLSLHPQGLDSVHWHKPMVGRWRSLTPMVYKDVLRDYLAGRRQDLDGLLTLWQLDISSDGRASLTLKPLRLVLSGSNQGRLVPNQIRDQRTTIKELGVEVRDAGDKDVLTLLKMTGPSGHVLRGLYIDVGHGKNEKASHSFIFRSFMAKQKRYVPLQESLVFVSQRQHGSVWGAMQKALQKSLKDFCKSLNKGRKAALTLTHKAQEKALTELRRAFWQWAIHQKRQLKTRIATR